MTATDFNLMPQACPSYFEVCQVWAVATELCEMHTLTVLLSVLVYSLLIWPLSKRDSKWEGSYWWAVSKNCRRVRGDQRVRGSDRRGVRQAERKWCFAKASGLAGQR